VKLGPHNDALAPILNLATEKLSEPNSSTTDTSPVDFAGLVPANLTGWFYTGSLTSATAGQPVTFFVLATPITLDAAQLKQYETLASGAGFLPSNRPIQPLDGRQINEFTYNVNFQNQSIAGLDFTNERAFTG